LDARGLIGWWTFDDGTGREQTGSVFGGSSMNATPVVNTTGPIPSAGIVQYNMVPGIGFRGLNATTGGFYKVAARTWPGTGGMTMMCWLFLPGSMAQQELIQIVDGGTSNPYFQWQLPGGGDTFVRFFQTGSIWIGRSSPTGQPTSVKPNVWQHLAATWDGGTTTGGVSVKTYYNGIRSDTSDNNGGAFTGPLSSTAAFAYLGGFQSIGIFNVGNMDDVRIYNRALSQAEIIGIASEPYQPAIDVESAVFYMTVPPPAFVLMPQIVM
jgi:hypothetical protein